MPKSFTPGNVLTFPSLLPVNEISTATTLSLIVILSLANVPVTNTLPLFLQQSYNAFRVISQSLQGLPPFQLASVVYVCEMEQPPPYTDEERVAKQSPVAGAHAEHSKRSQSNEAPWPADQSIPSRHVAADAQHAPALPEQNPPSNETRIERGDTTPGTKSSLANRTASARIDNVDDRTAAEALLGLGKAPAQDLAPPVVPSPAHSNRISGLSTPLQYYPIGISHTSTASTSPEPLLSLLTSSHPWLGGTIHGSISAYSASKSYTPRIVQYGAGIVETTVGTVGRATGVEGSIRRYLDSRQPQHQEHEDDVQMNQQPKIETQLLDPMTARDLTAPRKGSIAGSVDSLPLYSDDRSPAYSEVEASSSASPSQTRTHIPRSWSSQLMISTSGLGAALNENALRSLKFCLTTLNGANKHIRNLVEALRRLLHDYNGTNESLSGQGGGNSSDGDAIMSEAPSGFSASQNRAGHIAARIKQLNAEIWNTFKNVVNSVSAYTGGALPENASMVVKWQLMSVPQRWQRAVSRTPRSPNAAETGQNGGDETVHSADRMIAFAIEGLDMMDQVGGVVESTISSAEKWLDSMGRRGHGESTQEESGSSRDQYEVHMSQQASEKQSDDVS